MLDARTILGGSVHIRRMCAFMGYNNNMAPVLPVYCPDIYGKFISFYAATHSRESGDVLALIVGNFVCIKYWGSFIFVFLFNYGLHVLPVWLSVCLSVSNQVVRLISIKISSSGADNIELKKGLPAPLCCCLLPCAVVARLVKCRSRCHAHRNLHDCVWMDCHANTQVTHTNTLSHSSL